MNTPSEILIVEDSMTQAIRLQDSLERHHFSCLIANNGKNCLDILNHKIPTLIISDIVMPEMDGYELCRKIKQTKALNHIPVILLTSLSDPRDVIEALQCGADNFVTKPYNEEFLISRINNIIQNQNFRQQGLSDHDVEIVFDNKPHLITSDKTQIVDLLFSTYENAILKNHELEEANRQLVITQRDLKQKNIELEKLNEQKNYFLGMVAHDLRNPLGAIFNSSDLLLDHDMGPLNQDQKEIIQNVKTSSEFMLHLVNDFLDIAKIESGKLTLNCSETDIIPLIKQNVYFNQMFATKKQITLTFHEPEPSQAFHASIDSSKIQQVLNNLISNAIKFTQIGGKVDVYIQHKNNDYIVSVADNGPGIPENEQDILFNPFQSTSVKSSAGEKSTGLGLAIVKKIIQEHHGKIWVISKINQGSTFYFSIPCQFSSDDDQSDTQLINSQSKAENDSQTIQTEATNAMDILLVEDNKTSQKVANKIINKIGYNVDIASNGKEAVKALQKKNYALVLMDIQMPVMDGIQATLLIRDLQSPVLNHSIPIIAMTAATMDWDEKRCRAAGMNDFITKPIHSKHLEETINKYIVKESNASPEPAHDNAIFDYSILMEHLNGDMALFSKVIQKFINKIPYHISLLQKSIETHHFENIQTIARKITAESATIGARQTQQVSVRLEQLAREGDLSEVKNTFTQLKVEVEQLKHIINQKLMHSIK